uniref:Repressor of RNA polymerase III transcription MAF1 n=2 Tax=Caenorhabditis tropicalis TaxID=1561998 RepID=A0A1I7T4I6_9PELO
MKFLESSEMDVFSQTLATGAIDCVIDFKLETYSSKMVTSEKKQWKSNDKSVMWGERQPLGSYDEMVISASPSVGHNHRLRHLSERSCSGGSDNDFDNNDFLIDSISRKRLYDLTQVLNNSFPDHDFTNASSEAFALVNYTDLSRLVDMKLETIVRDYHIRREELWGLIDDAIVPSDCQIYSFKSQFEDDPFTEDGCIWALAFIFYNKGLKRFVLLTIRCLSKQADTSIEIFPDFSEDEAEAQEK